MTFANGGYLFLLLLIIPYVVWYFMAHRKEPTMIVPDISVGLTKMSDIKANLVHVPFLLRIFCFIMIVLMLSRPQTSNHLRESEVQGIDIMLSIDVSTSMLAEDLKPNRISAAREVASRFVADCPNDNIGLTVFAAEAFTQCPLTTDHSSLLKMFNGVNCELAMRGLIDDGTAIGMGLANAISRLKESKAKSKVIVLLTDGSNNQGEISPKTAAEIAKLNGIRVYTIGVGTNGTAAYPYPLPGGGVKYVQIPVEIDENTLMEIAEKTNGRYYRATSSKQLAEIYQEIGNLEKTKLLVKQYDKRYEAYGIFALLAVLSLLIELLLQYTILRKIP